MELYSNTVATVISLPLGSMPNVEACCVLKNEHGATAIEYGLIAAGISIAIIAVVNGLGTTLNDKFNSISTQLH